MTQQRKPRLGHEIAQPAAGGSSGDALLARRIHTLYSSHETQIVALREEVATLKQALQDAAQQRQQVISAMQDLHRQLTTASGTDESPPGSDVSVQEIVDAVGQLAKESEHVKGMLRSSLAWFRALTENALDITTILDAGFNFTFLTPSVSKLLGHDTDELMGQPLLSLVHPEDLTLVRHWLNTLVIGVPGAPQVTLRLRHVDGNHRVLEVTGNNCLDLEAVNGIVINGRDVTERTAAEARIRHLAHHDELTGLPNRTLMRELAHAAMARADRDGTQVAIMFLDLDRFKHVNDSLGHQVGDCLLQHVASVLKGSLRSVDVVGRLGGDEFLMLFPDLCGPEDARQVADRIVALISHTVIVDNHELHASASIGIALYPQDATSLDMLMRHADTAMYHAKSAGRNTCEFFRQDMNNAVVARLSMESRLRRAVREQEFELFYQPIVQAGSGAIVAAEALLRWRDPEHGLVAPMEFIPMAEDLGMIQEIGAWVLHEACRQNSRWQASAGLRIPIAVNLSAEQFRTRELLDVVSAALQESGLDPSWLHLEITESLLMENTRVTIAMLKELNDMGLQLSIDDFGTGYSSLSYLTRFPIQKLKIDKSFVRDLREDRTDAAVTSAVIALGHSLNLTVLAEGVETVEQFAFLRARGCDELQGYYFSRPLPAAEFEHLVQNWRITDEAPCAD